MAMAPDQVGIGIRRYFTRAGQHPYDTVAWERRDARIPNYKQGGDAFFQPGVEFPVTWSQNATNIVAQKYFRGQLDTPERESSLRQVIDRVANTIGDWGERDGYFVDEVEAEAFRDELKFLLVHQRAAFNSPVWFNIGVKGVPAQGSACFILAVDDTMSSILNWYVEEGTIFKGGSGSGINLSNIRSSLEPLAGGGTASGPVSFMRGADASAGTIKCLHAGTEVTTDHGSVPIRSVAPGWRVLTRHGFRTVTAVHDNGIRALVRVRTALGDEILCTPEHRFRVRSPEGEVWREAGELRVDDYVVVDLGQTDYGITQRLVAEEPTGFDESPLPETLDEAFSVWLGWAHGEGRLRSMAGSGALAVHLDGEDQALVERYRAFTQSVFGQDVAARTARGGDSPPATLCPPRVARFLQANGLWRPGTATIPRLVRSSPATVRAAFLAGLFESDGHVQHGCPTLWTRRRGLALEVHRLLLSIGIPSKISQARAPVPAREETVETEALEAGAVPTSGPGSDGLYRVRVVGGEGVRRFAKLVGFVSEGKARLLEAALDRPDAFEASWFFPHVDAELDNLGARAGAGLRSAISSHRHDTHPYGMSLARAAAIQAVFLSELQGALARFAQGEELYVPVTVEPAGEGPTVDLTVKGVHEYLVHQLVTHNSGGKTRRAAKMVILNVDHPDVEHFIWCKAVEERKARALAAAGFDMDLDGVDSHSTQYQNANNSVRVTDDFMEAVVNDREWGLRAVTTGEVLKTVPARALMHQIAEAAWECADPGMQFDTTINRWHTAANTGRINASNPCFPGDALVHTDKGLIPFAELVDRTRVGESFGVYTHDATSPDAPAERLEITSPEAVMITGLNEIVKLRFSNGMELRCTPGHRIFTTNRGYVPAAELTEDDEVKALDLPAPAVNADWRLPVSTDGGEYTAKGDHAQFIRLPEKWTEEFAHYLGWLVGDGCISGNVVTTVYGGGDDQEEILPRHQELLAWMNGDRPPKPSLQRNGTVQLRQSRRVIARFLEALGITHSKASEKRIPWSIQQAPPEIVAAFLRGLFDADGCVYDGKTNRYVGLGSASPELLKGAQRLLTTFGIFSRIYNNQKMAKKSFSYVRKDGSEKVYESKPMYDLRIANRSIEQFLRCIGFRLPGKLDKAADLVYLHDVHDTKTTVRLVERIEDGVELTYNLSEPRNHSYVVQGICVRNCSEYMHLDNSACNLASLNLMKFLNDDGSFDVDGFKAAIEVVFTAQEILVGNADYPTEKIAETTRAFRQLGLGYANLGALLMAQGLPYDSEGGRAWAGAITALMTGHAYATSARTAGRMGPFAGYAENKEPTLKVLGMHRAEVEGIDASLVPGELLQAAHAAWDKAVETAETHGVRNSQASVLAPTGCLVGGSLVATDRGLVRVRSLGDPDGPQWQELGIGVLTDEGPRTATQFYVNGLESVVDVATRRGYRIQGTTKHRIKVVDGSGQWVWRRFADLRAGDMVPLALGQLLGEAQPVSLPPLAGTSQGTDEQHIGVPQQMTAELAEFVGYFMGDGSLQAKGLRLCVTGGDHDVVAHLEQLAKRLFGVEARVRPETGSTTVEINSVRLAGWWEGCGFATSGHRAKGSTPHIPDAVLQSNDADVYRAFVRGLFEADGTVTAGYPSWTTTSAEFSHDVQTLLLALGFVTTRSFGTSGRGSRLAILRLLNKACNARWLDEIGFISGRKARAVDSSDCPQSARYDHVPVSRELIDRVAPANDRNRKVALLEHRRGGVVTRRLAEELYAATGDAELGRLLGFFFDRVASAVLGGEELTYDLSVPENVTYVANGFVSHNTIGLMMDCDTTGIEPDLALTKAKKLVGGGTMFIVNQTIPRALQRLGYSDDQVAAIIEHIDEHKTILGAPGLRLEDLPVFACAMGDNPIHYMGHVKMMSAVQPFISGAISKCVVGETLISTADGLVRIGALHQGERADSFRDEVIEVASLGGTRKTDAFYYGGVRPVREVVLHSGHRVVGTPNHRLLVGGRDGLAWRRLDEISAGQYVATRYGADLWSSVPARLDRFEASPAAVGPASVTVPTEMTGDLAFLLGAFAASGRLSRDHATVTISHRAPAVLERLRDIWRSHFGLEARLSIPDGRCPSVSIASTTVAEFLDHLGAGELSSFRRVPASVLASPREMVVSYLEGVLLASRVTRANGAAAVSVALPSAALLDDLQAILTNLGVLHIRVDGELEVTGHAARRLLGTVPLADPKATAQAAEILAHRDIPGLGGDVLPGFSPRELYLMIPPAGRDEFTFLRDSRVRHVSRRTVEAVAAVPGVELPEWLRSVVADGLHFSPVDRVADAGEREVFDLSVPLVHAFVGNGIVNHNTINMPEEATVEEVEDLHVEAWRLGLKAIAIYRDNCKVAQPLSTQKKVVPAAAEPLAQQVERVVETIVLQEPVRKKLPRKRNSKTFSFRVADCHGYVTVGEYEDGRPGEIFLKVAKQGSTLAGIMDAFAISVSHGLQYGVPLKAFADMFINMRFEPAGITDDPEIRLAASLVDYIFRRLAVEYLPYDERLDLGILTVGERSQPTLPGVEEAAAPPELSVDLAPASPDLTLDLTDRSKSAPSTPPTPPAPPASPAPPPAGPQAAAVPEGSRRIDAPYCYNCGMEMQRAGSCYVCSSCGATSGCS